MHDDNGKQRNARLVGPMPPEEEEVTLLFCDVVRSTELTRRLGDRGAYRVIQGFHTLVVSAANQHAGQELELRGDGVLLAFTRPDRAVACAIQIQRGLLELPRGRRVSARVGVHTGTALRIDSGYFGSNVILSARLAEEAAPGEIIVSAAIVQHLAEGGLRVDAGRWVSLKGIPEPTLVFPLSWRTPGRAPAEPPCPSPAHEALLVTLDRMRESRVNDEEGSCILGRRSAV